MTLNGNKPANPFLEVTDFCNGPGAPYKYKNYTGLTKREYFAGLILSGMLANPSFADPINAPKAAVSAADLLLAELEKSS
jgi:hypothetical protein